MIEGTIDSTLRATPTLTSTSLLESKDRGTRLARPRSHWSTLMREVSTRQRQTLALAKLGESNP